MGKSNNSKSKVNKARIAAHQGRRGGANAKLSRKQRKKKMSEDEWFERREQLVMPNVAAAVGINLLGTCAGGGGGGAAASYTAAALGEVADPDVPGGSDGEDGVEGEQQPTQHPAGGGGGDGSGGNNHAGKKRKKKRHTRQKTERLLAGTAGRQKRRQGLPGLFALSILSVLSNTIACVGSVTGSVPLPPPREALFGPPVHMQVEGLQEHVAVISVRAPRFSFHHHPQQQQRGIVQATTLCTLQRLRSRPGLWSRPIGMVQNGSPAIQESSTGSNFRWTGREKLRTLDFTWRSVAALPPRVFC